MFIIDKVNPPKNDWTDDANRNKYITETAGFVPLDVKLKQFEIAGYKAQLSASEFNSSDLRDVYLNPNFNITPEDDLEEIQDKLFAQQAYMQGLKKSKLSTLSAGKVESTSVTDNASSDIVDNVNDSDV